MVTQRQSVTRAGRAAVPAIGALALLLTHAASVRAAEGRVIRITTAAAQRTAVEQTEWAVGVIESRVAAQVAAEVAGKVVKVLADEGQGVEAGQVLAEIEPRQYRYSQDADQAEVGRLSALLRNKQQELDRARKLVAERLIAAEQVDAIEADLDALKQQLEGARAKVAESERRLDKTRVTAPVKAEIAERLVDVGDFVQARWSSTWSTSPTCASSCRSPNIALPSSRSARKCGCPRQPRVRRS
jgi:multidrug efflux pump subunit AcrA (membrane-fusion protein)